MTSAITPKLQVSDTSGQAPACPDEDSIDVKIKNFQVSLRMIPLLANLAVDEMETVKNNLRVKRFTRRATVIQKGSPGDSLLFLLSGKLQVVDVTEDGRIVGLRMLSEGDFFGEISVIRGSPRSASVVSLSEVLVAFLPSKIALHLFSHSPSVAHHVLNRLATKIQEDSQFRSLLSISDTSKRICSFLILMKKNSHGNLEVVENLPTHHDIASMLNTSRETVTRTLLTLAQKGIIQKDLRRLIIRDAQALQRVAQSEQAD